MKIHLFHKKLIGIGGAEQFLFDLATALIQKGIDVEILTFKLSIKAPAILKPKITIIPKFSDLRKHCNQTDNTYICAYGEIELFLASLFTKSRYILTIHQPSTMTFKPDYKQTLIFRHRAKRLVDTPTWNKLNKYYRDFTNLEVIRHEIKSYLRYISQVMAFRRYVLSDYAVKEKQQLLGLRADKMQAAFFSEEISEIYQTYDKVNDFLIVARLDENKRIIQSIDIFKRYLDSIDDKSATLTIIGDGPLMSEIKQHVKNYGIDNNVNILGFVSRQDVLSTMRSSKVLLAIDWADFRLTMFEAIIRRCKVIVAPEAEIEDIFLEYKIVHKLATNVDQQIIDVHQFCKVPYPNPTPPILSTINKYTWESYVKKLLDHLA